MDLPSQLASVVLAKSLKKPTALKEALGELERTELQGKPVDVGE